MSKYIHNFKQRNIELLERINIDIPLSVSIALKEDLGDKIDLNLDLTSLILPLNKNIVATIYTKEDGVLCGCKWVEEVFKQLGGSVFIEWKANDGEIIKANQLLCTLKGLAKTLLIGERTALNFLQTMSGVAKSVKRYVDVLKDTNVTLLDTRKTIPGLRTALKYAVLCGGGNNHRLGLNDFFLIKENHIAVFGSISKAISKALSLNKNVILEVEVENLEDLYKALDTEVDIIMLDNFKYEDIIKAVNINNKRVKLEASGNISLCNVKKYATTGIDYISVGSLTKNIQAIDFSMRIVK